MLFEAILEESCSTEIVTAPEPLLKRPRVARNCVRAALDRDLRALTSSERVMVHAQADERSLAVTNSGLRAAWIQECAIGRSWLVQALHRAFAPVETQSHCGVLLVIHFPSINAVACAFDRLGAADDVPRCFRLCSWGPRRTC